jgi:outer membrane protein TolC
VFAGNDRVPPDFRAAIQAALAASPVVVAQRKEVEAAQSRDSAERARRRPVLSAEAEAAAYKREFSSRDAVRGTLTLRIPLYQGGEDRAAIDQAHARLDEQKALLARSEHELRARVLELVQEIETLRAEREAAKVRRSYRELYLDRSRSLYELEMRSSLGDAMTRQSESDLITAQVEYRLALAWAKLEALGGIPPPAAATEPAK